MEDSLNIKRVKINNPECLNLILGQAHFIKTVEDLHETLTASMPGIKFGIAFIEASGPCLVRISGNDTALQNLAGDNALKLSAGHAFIIFLKDAFPVNVLNALKAVPEVCSIYCATANPVEVIIAESSQGCGILGVIDGLKTKGIEGDCDVAERKAMLRQFGYKLK
jgi:hypothetical protein